MRVFSPALVVSVIAGFVAVTPAVADTPNVGQSTEPVQLDQRAPAEMLLRDGQNFSVLAWNGAREHWIEVFRGEGQPQFGRPLDGAFADIGYGGYVWKWNGHQYVPRLPDDGTVQKQSISTALIQQVGDRLGVTVPPSTQAYSYTEEDEGGSPAQLIVLDQSLDTCVMGGEACIAVVVRNGELAADLEASMAYGFRISDRYNARGHRYIENGREDGTYLIDPDTGAEAGAFGAQEVKVAPVQVEAPK
jgi:hypothetical protein